MMDTKVDQTFQPKFYVDKKLSKSFDKKLDEEIINYPFKKESFLISEKFSIEHTKDSLWKSIKDKAKKKSDMEYFNCVNSLCCKFICTIRKYVTYFLYLKNSSYEIYKMNPYNNNNMNITNKKNVTNNINIRNNINNSYSNDNINYNLNHSNNSSCSKHNKYNANNIDDINIKNDYTYNYIYEQIFFKYNSSFYEYLMFNLMKKIIHYKNIILNKKENINNSYNNNDIKNIDGFLIFQNLHFEEIFLNTFYSSFPFKIFLHSLYMIFICFIYFVVLYFILLKNIYTHPLIFHLSILKFFFDIIFFLSFILYSLFLHLKKIDNIIYSSYISSYIFVCVTFLYSFLILKYSSYSVKMNNNTYQNYFVFQNMLFVLINIIYIFIFCFLKNYMILYSFLYNCRFSIFSILFIFLYYYIFFTLDFYTVIHFPFDNFLCPFIAFLFFSFLFIFKIITSLYYEYVYEKKYRILYIKKNNLMERRINKRTNTNINNVYFTKYFSIDNTIPTSPIEDILNNFKHITETINIIEENPNQNLLTNIKKIKEKIKNCDNILRTKNINQVQIGKYRKFEKVYNIWCLDKMYLNNPLAQEVSKSVLSNSLNRISFNSFSNMHSLLSSKFQEHYNDIYDWNGNIENIYKGNTFISIGYKLLYPLGVLEANFDKEKLKKFLFKMCSYYNDVPYHTSLHAAQVAHFSKSMLFMLDMNHKISAIDEFCLHISSLCHDTGHPGLNNYFLINSENNLALTYNDNSVLENYHCSLLFKTLKNPNYNIFEYYPYHIFISCKKNIIRAILSTDMKNHFEYISDFRTSKEFIDYDNLSNDQIWQIFCLILKASDIGHSTLEWKKHLQWTLKINEEFYLQGLLEKSLNIQNSFLCDIDTMNKLAFSQIDFLKHLCIPLFNELNYICKNNDVYTHCIQPIENNIERWEGHKNDNQNLGLHEKYKDENLLSKLELIKFE
ncbi:cGMP-specific phosphodiesterase [Plasmodium gaboni]|uniref:cGMP-specific phosphodiesterase n=1 Tax=Plasmodium gaboni TaxID=647221 RepID=A0A151LG39_9APIC|nr:cGMP-specific phosphodiesterase [Plasmodium gaboni]KYN97912.1 cGMP-specific phosphodiesterase [Plasmodium gaboni]